MQKIQNLLEPINVLQPAGKDLTYSVDFDDIKRLRSFDDPTLDQGEWVTDLKMANWPEVIKRCEKLLQESSKDLRLVMWMTEALVHTKGFFGLAEGYTLFTKMSEQYWDSLYPEAEEGDHEPRMGIFRWLISQSAQWVSTIDAIDGAEGKFSFADFTAARARSGGSRSGEAPVVTQEQLDRARAATPLMFYQELWEGTCAAMSALDELQCSAERLFSGQAPGFSVATDALQSAHDVVRGFARDAGVDTRSEADLSGDQQPQGCDVAALTPDQSISATSSDITSRAEALAMLRKIAEYFRHAEPHSPAAYLADQAAKWGAMTLHEWLPLVLRDEGALSRLEEILGVPAKPRA